MPNAKNMVFARNGSRLQTHLIEMIDGDILMILYVSTVSLTTNLCSIPQPPRLPSFREVKVLPAIT